MLDIRSPSIDHPLWRLKLNLLRVIMFASSIAFTVAVFLQVVTRYLFNYSLFGIEEFASFAGIIMYFAGAAYGTHERSHISASLVETLFGDSRFTLAVHAFTRALACALTIYILVIMWDLLVFTDRMNTKSTELRVPMMWIYGTMFAGLALSAFYFFLEFIETVIATIRGQSGPETDT